MSTPLLNAVRSPQDLRPLTQAQLADLAQEIRSVITDVVGRNGGHLASNLGIVDLTLALHRVYDFRTDRLVFDVGHQCYAHKLITGRRARFATLRQHGGITGFPNPRESECDPFVCGHASTSISSALGLAAAARLRRREEHVVALVGDGAIGGGLCFEAINHAGHAQENLLVILNDNEMSIARTVGALSNYLTEIRSRPGTARLREDIHAVFNSIPLIGHQLDWLQERLLEAIKHRTDASVLFESLGFRYFGPVDGHDIAALEHELGNLKQLPGPRFLHVVTSKGRGVEAAAADPETYHSAVPFEVRGCGEIVPRDDKKQSFTDLFVDHLIDCARSDETIVALTAAMPAGTGVKRLAEVFPERFIDVGICEAHCVTFAGALARAGMKPVVAIYSTFLQRGYDQIIHDIAVQPDLGVVFALDRAGLVGADGPTHHGVFDIAYLRHIPGLTLMAPRDGEELRRMLDFALTMKTSVALRYPRTKVPNGALPRERTPLALGRSETLRTGTDGTILAYGRMVAPSLRAAEQAAGRGVDLSVVNARFAKPLDEEAILVAAGRSPLLVTVEDHALAGGFGSAVGELLLDKGVPCRLVRIGIPDRFVEHGRIDELDKQLGLDVPGLVERFLRAARADDAARRAV